MALQTIPGVEIIPDYPAFSAVATSFSGAPVVDASTERGMVRIIVPKTGVLDKFEFRVNTVSGFPAGEAFRASFQDISSGFPDGTADQFRDVTASIASDTWIVPGLMTSDGTDTGAKRSVTRGQELGCVVDFTSFTNGSVQLTSLAAANTAACGLAYGSSYLGLFTAAAWGAVVDRLPVIALKYNDGTYEYVPGCYPCSALTAVTFNSGSTPDERGLIFQLPYPRTLWGFWLRAEFDNAADVVLYDSDGTSVLETVTLAVTSRPVLTAIGYARPFVANHNLLAGTTYRLVVKPGASDVLLNEFDVGAAAIMDAFSGGQAFHHTYRTDAGAWTQTTTKRPWMGLLLKGADDGVQVGGGGGAVGPWGTIR